MRTTAVVRVLLLSACLALVLGILGMHALRHEATMVEHPGTSMPGMTHAVAEATGTADALPADADADVAAMSGAEHSMHDMMMLCVAMLIGAAAGLLLASGLRRVASASSLGSLRPRRVAAAVRPQRATTGPPYVWAFSVIRC